MRKVLFPVLAACFIAAGCADNNLPTIDSQLSNAEIDVSKSSVLNVHQETFDEVLKKVEDKDALRLTYESLGVDTSIERSIDSSGRILINQNASLDAKLAYYQKYIATYGEHHAKMATTSLHIVEKDFHNKQSADMYMMEYNLKPLQNKKATEVTLNITLENIGEKDIAFPINEAQIKINGNVTALKNPVGNKEAKGKQFFPKGVSNIGITFHVPRQSVYKTIEITLPAITDKHEQILIEATTIILQ